MNVKIVFFVHVLIFANFGSGVDGGKALTPLRLDRKVACMAEHLKVNQINY